MSIIGGGNLYPNWLGTAALTIPNNQAVVGGNVVNVVPVLVNSGSSNATSWADANFKTFAIASNVPSGTYMVGCEVFSDPLTSSNAGAGWNQGDYFNCQISDNDLTAAGALQTFVRPYTEGVQVNATAAYNKGATNCTMSGILTLSSNTNIRYTAAFNKDTTTSYPQTRQMTMSGFWYQKLA